MTAPTTLPPCPGCDAPLGGETCAACGLSVSRDYAPDLTERVRRPVRATTRASIAAHHGSGAQEGVGGRRWA
jgi:hypothetical protein